MIRLVKKCLISQLVILAIITSIISITSAEPIVEDVTFYPENPAPLSTITFNATVTGENISVYLILKECKGGICFVDFQNLSMENSYSNMYQSDITLIHDDATYIKYNLNIESNGVWYNTSATDADLFVENENNDTDNGGTNGGNGGDSDNKTPGFEFVSLIASIIIVSMLVYKRKKMK